MKTAYINAKMINRKQAFIVENGRFTHVGNKRKILSQNIDEIIDLKDQTVLPGFNDAHMHVLGLGKMMTMVDVSEEPSIESMIDSLKVSNQPPIIGRGYKETQFEERRAPTKADLDKVSKEVPVLLYRFCSHVMIANSKAIEMALELNGAYPENKAHYDLEKGKFAESARSFLMALEPEDDTALKAMILKGQDHLLKHGITSVGSDDFGVVSVHYERVLNVFKRLSREDKLKLRVLEQVNIPDETAFDDFLTKGYPHKQFGRY
ncbi:MAG: amidohydrolase family protein, partial [Bacillota bacterium]